MSVQVSYKKQTVFFIILILIVFTSLEMIIRVYDPTLYYCNMDNPTLDEELRDTICKEHNLLIFDLKTLQIESDTKLETVTINNLGFRGEDILAKNSSTYRIVSVGGSTTFGTGVLDNETYPYYLEKYFHENDLKNIEVINAGLGGIWSFQEVQLISYKIKELKPDLIIVYDGWNDVIASQLEEEIESNDNELIKIKEDRFIYTGNELSHFLKNFHLLKTINRIITYENDLLQYQNRTISTYDYSDSEQKSIEWYQRWSKTCNELKEETKIIVILQPMAGSGTKKLTPTESISATRYDNKNILIQFDKYFEKMEDLETHCESTYDFRKIFDNETSKIFIDNGHVNAKGNEIIAEKIYQKILPTVLEDISK